METTVKYLCLGTMLLYLRLGSRDNARVVLLSRVGLGLKMVSSLNVVLT
jgi:hypothetical protein